MRKYIVDILAALMVVAILVTGMSVYNTASLESSINELSERYNDLQIQYINMTNSNDDTDSEVDVVFGYNEAKAAGEKLVDLENKLITAETNSDVYNKTFDEVVPMFDWDEKGHKEVTWFAMPKDALDCSWELQTLYEGSSDDVKCTWVCRSKSTVKNYGIYKGMILCVVTMDYNMETGKFSNFNKMKSLAASSYEFDYNVNSTNYLETPGGGN